MKTNLITLIATTRNPAIAGIPWCPAMANGQGLPRLNGMTGFDYRSSFKGAHFEHPIHGHSWNLNTGNIRKGRYMA
jgi:hypothetical protein